MTPFVSVVIPARPRESAGPAIESLSRQTVQDFDVHLIVDHEGRGQSWARNRGAEGARGRYLLFSDTDIEWEPDAIEVLIGTLEASNSIVEGDWRIGYSYGSYKLMSGTKVLKTVCDEPWSWDLLRRRNFVSTMSLMHRVTFQRFWFNESLRRLEDWEMFIRMGLAGLAGRWCGKVLFRTQLRPGVSYRGPISHEEAESKVLAMHREKLAGVRT